MAKDIFNSMTGAMSKALDTMKGAVGGTVDPQVDFYDKLNEADFGVLVEQYGTQDTTRYIEEMERRKMGQKRSKKDGKTISNRSV